jgi:hypothetical protein
MDDLEGHLAELRQLLGMCAKLAPTFTNRPTASAQRVLDSMREAIEDLWTWLASNVGANFQGATIDNEHPGYVVRGQVLVPFYLLEDLPGSAELAELVSLGLSLRVTKGGVIC